MKPHQHACIVPTDRVKHGDHGPEAVLTRPTALTHRAGSPECRRQQPETGVGPLVGISVVGVANEALQSDMKSIPDRARDNAARLT